MEWIFSQGGKTLHDEKEKKKPSGSYHENDRVFHL
jgi:hypothetical protein